MFKSNSPGLDEERNALLTLFSKKLLGSSSVGNMNRIAMLSDLMYIVLMGPKGERRTGIVSTFSYGYEGVRGHERPEPSSGGWWMWMKIKEMLEGHQADYRFFMDPNVRNWNNMVKGIVRHLNEGKDSGTALAFIRDFTTKGKVTPTMVCKDNEPTFRAIYDRLLGTGFKALKEDNLWVIPWFSVLILSRDHTMPFAIHLVFKDWGSRAFVESVGNGQYVEMLLIFAHLCRNQNSGDRLTFHYSHGTTYDSSESEDPGVISLLANKHYYGDHWVLKVEKSNRNKMFAFIHDALDMLTGGRAPSTAAEAESLAADML